MCGITGAVWWDPRQAIDPTRLDEMTTTLAHRGPDDAQTWRNPRHPTPDGQTIGVGLGFRRLSIIDLEGARQPMASEDGQVRMVFNGEIYNFAALRRRLEGGGHRFVTRGDGESILHLYEDQGTDAFRHLNGMFAVALWDARRHRLVLARDRLGQKPLYYALRSGSLVFASELKAIAAVPGICDRVDPAAIDLYLTYQYVPHPHTIWEGVHKLPPGHFLVWERGQVTVESYWDFDPKTEQAIDGPEACERLRELLTDSVRLRLNSDVPLGAFLSGGVDSSLITAVAQSLSAEPVRTFSIGFPQSDFDETGYAAEVAAYLGTRHERLEVRPDGVHVIDRLAWHFDEPFGDSSAIPTWYLSELTKRHVTVALSGDGGDELFAGYERYRALWLSDRLRRFFPIHRLPGLGLVQRLPDSDRQRSLCRRVKRFCEALGEPAVRRYLRWLQIFPETMRAELYRDDFVARLPPQDPFEFLDGCWRRTEGRDLVSRASLTDLASYLPCDLMTKVDIASMAHGLEVRQPMLDYRLVEFAAALPVRLKFRGAAGKLILGDAFRGRIPDSIFRRPKMGFGVPIADWFRNELKPLVHDTLLSADSRSLQFFHRDAVERMVSTHESGERNHCYRLWNLLMLETWLRRWTS